MNDAHSMQQCRRWPQKGQCKRGKRERGTARGTSLVHTKTPHRHPDNVPSTKNQDNFLFYGGGRSPGDFIELIKFFLAFLYGVIIVVD